MVNLPQDLKDFLQSGRELKYDHLKCELGKITLKKFDDLKVAEVKIDSQESPIYDNDPNKDKDGYYLVPVISLIEECENYESEFALVWLPNENLFGSWDCDHWDLKTFLKLSWFSKLKWKDIVENPLLYLNAKWDCRSKVTKYFVPFPEYDFIERRY